ncbi:glycosyltransferase family 4 protein [Candidatus Darwinibacter acetoxidans]
MKVIWVVRPAEGGILHHLQQLLAGLDDWEIAVAAPPALKGLLSARRFIDLELVDGFRPKEDLAAVRRLKRILKQENARIVHAHGLKAALITAAALAPKRRPYFLFTAHNSLPQSSSRFMGWASTLVQRWLFSGMNTIISVSDAVRAQIIRYVPESKVLTIYNGICSSEFGQYPQEMSRSCLNLSPEDQVVGTVARLIPGKGVSTLLEAVSLVARILPQLHLVVVGDGSERAKLEAYSRRLGLGNRVHFVGWRDDVPSLMAGWDCFALPSLSEGFNLSVLEAMASRLPVVVSDLPALREAVVPGKGGLLVPPGSAAEWAAALLHVLKDPVKAKAMGAFNRERVEAFFGAERMVSCTRALYEGMIT